MDVYVRVCRLDDVFREIDEDRIELFETTLGLHLGPWARLAACDNMPPVQLGNNDDYRHYKFNASDGQESHIHGLLCRACPQLKLSTIDVCFVTPNKVDHRVARDRAAR